MGGGWTLAIYNFGIQVAPYEDPAVAGFRLREPLNFEAARRAVGFVDRSGYPEELSPESWGVQVFPRFLKESGRCSGLSSLSLWLDIESLMAFTYSGVHAEALRHAGRWNLSRRWPPLVLFWVGPGIRPQWREAVERFEYLADHGSSTIGFTFKQPYDPAGSAYAIDRTRVKAIAEANAAEQSELIAAVKTIPP